jgi:hypothetical protein
MGQIPIVHSPHLGELGSVLKLEGVTDAFGQIAHVGQEDKRPADLPCKLTDYRVLHAQNPPDTVAALCYGPPLADFTATARLFLMNDKTMAVQAIETVKVQGPAAEKGNWLVFPFTHSLEAGQHYELRLTGTYSRTQPAGAGPGGGTPKVPESFADVALTFRTDTSLTVAKATGRGDAAILTSNMEMKVSPNAKLTDTVKNKVYKLTTRPIDPNDIDYDSIGLIFIEGSPTTDKLGTKLAIEGVTDAFGQEVSKVVPAKPGTPAAAPKSKDDAAYYFNFLHQAGVGITPTWIADVKVAPVLKALPGELVPTPVLNVDVGQGQVGQTKTNDLINPKLGLARFVETQNKTLQAMNFTTSFAYETNRAGDRRNGLFDGDWRFYFGGLSDPMAKRTTEALQAATKRAAQVNPYAKISPEEVPKAKFGYDIQIYVGTELGGSFTNDTDKSSDKSTSVLVPMYAIRRLRPHVAATFEFGRFTWSISAFPRYLFAKEFVTREVAVVTSGKTKQTIYLSTVSGWRPYGECTLSYSIDPAGHYSVNVAYKVGSQPPNFDRVNLVQSGILIRF